MLAAPSIDVHSLSHRSDWSRLGRHSCAKRLILVMGISVPPAVKVVQLMRNTQTALNSVLSEEGVLQSSAPSAVLETAQIHNRVSSVLTVAESRHQAMWVRQGRSTYHKKQAL